MSPSYPSVHSLENRLCRAEFDLAIFRLSKAYRDRFFALAGLLGIATVMSCGIWAAEDFDEMGFGKRIGIVAIGSALYGGLFIGWYRNSWGKDEAYPGNYHYISHSNFIEKLLSEALKLASADGLQSYLRLADIEIDRSRDGESVLERRARKAICHHMAASIVWEEERRTRERLDGYSC